MTNKLLTILVMIAVFFSPLVAAQSPRGGSEVAPRGDQPYPPGQVPFGQSGRGPGNNLAPPTIDPATSITRQQAVTLAHGSFQGRVLSVRLVDNNWRVRIDQNGTVFNVFVDGRTGEVSRFPD